MLIFKSKSLSLQSLCVTLLYCFCSSHLNVYLSNTDVCLVCSRLKSQSSGKKDLNSTFGSAISSGEEGGCVWPWIPVDPPTVLHYLSLPHPQSLPHSHIPNSLIFSTLRSFFPLSIKCCIILRKVQI